MFEALRLSEGKDHVIIYVENPKSKYPLPDNWNVDAGEELIGKLSGLYGKENVKVV